MHFHLWLHFNGYFFSSGKEINLQKGNLTEVPFSVLRGLGFNHNILLCNAGYEKTTGLFIFLL